jgi:hypothetical protein
VQTWCRGKKKFESETLCCDCNSWSWRAYRHARLRSSLQLPPAHSPLTLRSSLFFLLRLAPGSDPDFLLPEEYEKRRWDVLCADAAADKAAKTALMAHTIKA